MARRAIALLRIVVVVVVRISRDKNVFCVPSLLRAILFVYVVTVDNDDVVIVLMIVVLDADERERVMRLSVCVWVRIALFF